MSGWYGEDLAYIHDVGHAEFALESAPGIMEILGRSGMKDGLPLAKNHKAFVASKPA